jgi:hypothetical protein
VTYPNEYKKGKACIVAEDFFSGEDYDGQHRHKTLKG